MSRLGHTMGRFKATRSEIEEDVFTQAHLWNKSVSSSFGHDRQWPRTVGRKNIGLSEQSIYIGDGC